MFGAAAKIGDLAKEGPPAGTLPLPDDPDPRTEGETEEAVQRKTNRPKQTKSIQRRQSLLKHQSTGALAKDF
jgi:hypothetical protein